MISNKPVIGQHNLIMTPDWFTDKSLRICWRMQFSMDLTHFKFLLKAQMTKVKVIHLEWSHSDPLSNYAECCVMSCLQLLLASLVYVWKFTPGSTVLVFDGGPVWSLPTDIRSCHHWLGSSIITRCHMGWQSLVLIKTSSKTREWRQNVYKSHSLQLSIK